MVSFHRHLLVPSRVPQKKKGLRRTRCITPSRIGTALTPVSGPSYLKFELGIGFCTQQVNAVSGKGADTGIIAWITARSFGARVSLRYLVLPVSVCLRMRPRHHVAARASQRWPLVNIPRNKEEEDNEGGKNEGRKPIYIYQAQSLRYPPSIATSVLSV